MSDIIQALAKQCWSHTIDGTLIDGHLHFDSKKFAHLIIQECITICESGGPTQMTCGGAADLIRQRFQIDN